MKTPEELTALKEEVETFTNNPHALNEDELEQVTGGRHNLRSPLTEEE